MLSDVGHTFERQLGIVWKMPNSLRPLMEKMGHDLITRNGYDSFEVPIPTALLVDGTGALKIIYIEPGFHMRVEPETGLELINTL